MCGIMGYIGTESQGQRVVLDGLQALEYRGYDSAGVAVLTDDHIWTAKRAGKIDELIRAVPDDAPQGQTALGHTRWATHGPPTDVNAHPHADCLGDLVVIHNGIIENFHQLKTELMEQGHAFLSQTDTEVLAHRIESFYDGDLQKAVLKGLDGVEGAYAIAVLSRRHPDEIVVAKTASPLVIGLGDGANYLASGVPALLPHTKEMLFLDDGELATIRSDDIDVFDLDGNPIDKHAQTINWDPVTVQKQGYRHFMLKEMHEQPQAVADTLRGHADLESYDVHMAEVGLDPETLEHVRQITLIACGTAYHACWTSKYLWQRWLDVPINVELASEFRYSAPYLGSDSLVVAVSQSGETADTLAGVSLAREHGVPVLGLTNSPGSALERAANWTMYTHAGPEIGVASTKCFMVQLEALALIGLFIGEQRGASSREEIERSLGQLAATPGILEHLLKREPELESLARHFYDVAHFLYLGRDMLCPIAYEGALKLKEISYIHAEGYAAGEMKHGPIALIDEHMPVVVLATQNSVYEKLFSNIEEVKARKGIVIAVSDTRDAEIERVADHLIELPESLPIVTPMLFTIPMQLLAYHVAVLRGTDVDQPRNLAKSVTVE
ncbi:MAG: glutamine--fructose-6-phosphate transaminase (isomerizing) [Candidatus Bipolaricaulia bacterium]